MSNSPSRASCPECRKPLKPGPPGGSVGDWDGTKVIYEPDGTVTFTNWGKLSARWWCPSHGDVGPVRFTVEDGEFVYLPPS